MDSTFDSDSDFEYAVAHHVIQKKRKPKKVIKVQNG